VPGSGNIAFVEIGVAVTVIRSVVARLIGDRRIHSVLAEHVADFIDWH